MKKYLKCGLDITQINLVNSHADKIDGVEIHLSDYEGDWELLNLLETPIVNIHSPSTTGNECEINTLLSDENVNKNFKRLIDYCNGKSINIVIHYNSSLKTQLVEQFEDLTNYLVNTDVKILVENLSLLDGPREIFKIPEFCKQTNKRIKKEIFFPLLDICHLQMLMYRHGKSIHLSMLDFITGYNSKNCFIHLSQAIGDGYDERHGNNYDDNPELLLSILKVLHSVNRDVNIIIEVCDKNLSTKEESLSLLNQICTFGY